MACAEFEKRIPDNFADFEIFKLRIRNLAIFHPPFVAVAEVVEVGAECLLLLPSIHQGPKKVYLSAPVFFLFGQNNW